jgi:hypothetical protein
MAIHKVTSSFALVMLLRGLGKGTHSIDGVLSMALFSLITPVTLLGASVLEPWRVPMAYVLAVSGKAYVWAGLRQHRVGQVLEALGRGELLPEQGWKRISVGVGSKGPRLYDWLRLPLNPPMQEGFERWLVVRRSIEDPEELPAYTVFAPEGTSLEALAKAAGAWRSDLRRPKQRWDWLTTR